MKLPGTPLLQNVTGILVLGATFYAASFIQEHLAALTVYPADPNPATTTATVPSTLQHLYPLVATTKQSGVGPASTPPADINEAFQLKKAAKPETPETPDYFRALQSNKDTLLAIEAISDDGVVVNKRYFPFGSPLTIFSYPAPNGRGSVSPIVARGPSPNAIHVQEHPGTRRFTVKVPQ